MAVSKLCLLVGVVWSLHLVEAVRVTRNPPNIYGENPFTAFSGKIGWEV